MALTTYIGVGTNLSSSYYVRNFYTANREARTASKRRSMNSSELSLADGMALGQAVRKLRSTDLGNTHEVDIRNRVSAYIEVYNNALSSASGSSDRTLERYGKQMKALANEYAAELDKIGITVNKDGSLTRRDALFETADIAKFESLFSKDSAYMQRTASYAKKIERRGEQLALSAMQNGTDKTGAASNDATAILHLGSASSGTDATPAAQIVAESLGLPALPANGAGSHINIVL